MTKEAVILHRGEALQGKFVSYPATGALSSSMMTFQTDSSQVLEKDTLGCKLAKIISKRFTSKGWTNDL